MSRPDVYRQLMDDAKAAGWSVALTKKNHLHFVSPGGRSVFGPDTTGDHRAIHRVRAKLRRAGLDI